MPVTLVQEIQSWAAVYALTAYFLRGKARSFFCCRSVLRLACRKRGALCQAASASYACRDSHHKPSCQLASVNAPGGGCSRQAASYIQALSPHMELRGLEKLATQCQHRTWCFVRRFLIALVFFGRRSRGLYFCRTRHTTEVSLRWKGAAQV